MYGLDLTSFGNQLHENHQTNCLLLLLVYFTFLLLIDQVQVTVAGKTWNCLKQSLLFNPMFLKI